MDSSWSPWIGSVAGSLLVGLSGVVPLLFIPDSAGKNADAFNEDSPSLRLLLSFAVGGLLGDVFLHLLPEAWHMMRTDGQNQTANHVKLGLSLMSGLFAFALLERLLSSTSQESTPDEEDDDGAQDSDSQNNNNNESFSDLQKKKSVKASAKKQNDGWFSHPFRGISSKRITGYLNLVANGIDNFTHGLAVAGSFLVSTRVGLLTTAAILLHEIPHEVADFAILLRAGFGRWDAARAQLGTASIGLAGALAALGANGSEGFAAGGFTSWILPFTAGGFLHIALVTVLPELLDEKHPKQSLLQVLCMLAGIGATAAVSLLVD